MGILDKALGRRVIDHVPDETPPEEEVEMSPQDQLASMAFRNREVIQCLIAIQNKDVTQTPDGVWKEMQDVMDQEDGVQRAVMLVNAFPEPTFHTRFFREKRREYSLLHTKEDSASIEAKKIVDACIEEGVRQSEGEWFDQRIAELVEVITSKEDVERAQQLLQQATRSTPAGEPNVSSDDQLHEMISAYLEKVGIHPVIAAGVLQRRLEEHFQNILEREER